MKVSATSRRLVLGLAGLGLVAGALPGLFGWTVLRTRADDAAATLGGPFSLVDQEGHRRTAEDFRGRYLLIYFGFTYCPDICPTALLRIGDALGAFAEKSPGHAEQVTPLFITVDPARDSPAVLKDYLANFHPRLVGLTGEPDEIERVAKDYGAYFRRGAPDAEGSYLVEHSGFILLLGPDGHYLTHFDPDEDAEAIRQGLVAHMGAE